MPAYAADKAEAERLINQLRSGIIPARIVTPLLAHLLDRIEELEARVATLDAEAYPDYTR